MISIRFGGISNLLTKYYIEHSTIPNTLLVARTTTVSLHNLRTKTIPRLYCDLEIRANLIACLDDFGVAIIAGCGSRFEYLKGRSLRIVFCFFLVLQPKCWSRLLIKPACLFSQATLDCAGCTFCWNSKSPSDRGCTRNRGEITAHIISLKKRFRNKNSIKKRFEITYERVNGSMHAGNYILMQHRPELRCTLGYPSKRHIA